ncbi:MAG: hypothetical protein A2283_20385 [Lentisphaerae bacterium RIFOXYA12_FULL_48_11]|nr:MAG: hypothetical protein A2283_20385 [Lentisphaerae bacterium RIFOXYA12_FULL_48_11]
MHRCYVDPSIWNESEIHLPSDTEHHLVNVLRVSEGEMVEVFDGKGRHGSAQVDVARGRKAILKLSGSELSPKPGFSISLMQALPKGSRMDLIVEKATELGVSSIYPVMTERVVVRINDREKREERRDRWQRIAIRAAEQCGVNWVPEVKPLDDLSRIVSMGQNFDLFLVGALTGDAQPLHEVMNRVVAEKKRSAVLLVGPEGDLTQLELKLSMDAGAIPVSFGANVFRVETAAIFGISVLAYEFSSLMGMRNLNG